MVLRGRHGAEPGADEDDDSIRLLLRRLGSDTESLLRAEVALAKLEFRELAQDAALDGAKIGAAVAVAFVGGLAIVAWLVLALGDVLGDSYGIAALIVGAVLLLTGGLLARSGMKGLKRGKAPRETVESLQKNKEWAERELRQLRSGLSADKKLEGAEPARRPEVLARK